MNGRVLRTRLAILLLLLLVFATPAWSKSLELSPASRQGLELLNNGHLLEAYELLRMRRKESPDDPTILFLLAMTKWRIMSLSTYDRKDRNEVVALMDRLESSSQPKIKSNDDALFFYSGVQGLRAQLFGREGDWWKTAKLGKSMKKTAEDLIDRNPGYHEAYYLLGSYNYFADALPAYIKFFRIFMFLPGGDRAEGLKQLNRAYEKGQLASIEAGRTLALIYTFYEKHPQMGVKFCDEVLKKHPDSFDIGLYKGMNLYFGTDFEASENWLGQVISAIRGYSSKHGDEIVPAYAVLEREVRYWIARSLIRQKRMDEAEKMLLALKTPELHQPYWIQRGVYLSLAEIAYSKKNKNQAEALVSRVLSWQDVRDSHEKAKLLRSKRESIGKFDIDFR